MFGASVNIIETPGTFGHGTIAFKERPVIQLRGEKKRDTQLTPDDQNPYQPDTE